MSKTYSINITDPTYGAVGDGNTDDKTHIQDALNASWSNGYVVEIPEGTFLISDKLEIKQGTILKGAGKDKSIILCEKGDFYATGTSTISASAITIENLQIKGKSGQSANSIGIDIDGGPENASFIKINSVLVKDFTGDGIRLTRPMMNELTGVTVRGSTGNGFSIIGDGTSTTLKNCYSHENGGYGYYWTNVHYSSLINCASDYNTLGGYSFYIGSGKSIYDIALYSCGAENNDGPQFHFERMKGLTLNSLYINSLNSTNSKNLIHMRGCVEALISACYINSNPPSGYYSLLIDDLDGTIPPYATIIGSRFTSPTLINQSGSVQYINSTIPPYT